MATPNGIERLRFGSFELLGSTGELLKDGMPVKLQHQPFQVLRLLVSRRGELVSREEIQATLWGEGTTVEFDQGLNFCIRQIRAALNDDAREPRFIETLPKRGYRFIAPVDAVPSGETGLEPTEATPQNAVPRPRQPRKWWLAAMAAAAILVLALGGAILRRGSSTELDSIARFSKVTTYPGDEQEPSLSPDGRQVAFSWNGEKGRGRSIYVLQIGGQTPMQVTHHGATESAEDGFPAWSPDGSQIVFLRRYDVDHAEIVVIPAAGGAERKVQAIGAVHRNSYPLFAWAPDGKQILFTGQVTEDSIYHYTLSLFSLETGAIKPFHLAGSGSPGDASPAISPDGRWLVFSRYSEIAKAALMVQRLGAGIVPQGQPTAIPGVGQGLPRSPSWSPDSKRVVFSSGDQILEWAVGGGIRVVGAIDQLDMLSTVWQRDGHVRSITARNSSDSDIWRQEMDPATHALSGKPTRVAASTADENVPRISPDGRRIVFNSQRSNAPEIWIADANGENPRQLSHLNAYIAGYPRWSPDSKQIVFHARSRDEGDAWIYIVDADTGMPRRLAPGMTASWSWDGKYIYGDTPTGGKIIQVRISDGRVEPLFDGDMPVETLDGKRLLYAKTDGSGIYSRALDGNPAKNPEERIVDDYTRAPGAGFVPVHDGFFYVGYFPEGKPQAFKFYDSVQRRATEISPFLGGALTVSLDQRQLLYVVRNSSFDLLLIEFR